MSEELVRDKLIAGDFPIVTESVTIASGASLKRGTVLGIVTASGKCAIVNSALTDGTQSPKYVLLEDADASAGDRIATVGVTGEYNANALIFGGTDTYATHKVALRALCIFLKTTLAA